MVLKNSHITLVDTGYAEMKSPRAAHVSCVRGVMVAQAMLVRENSYEHGIKDCQRSAQHPRERPLVHDDNAILNRISSQFISLQLPW